MYENCFPNVYKLDYRRKIRIITNIYEAFVKFFWVLNILEPVSKFKMVFDLINLVKKGFKYNLSKVVIVSLKHFFHLLK